MAGQQPYMGVKPNASVENWAAAREALEFGFKFDRRRWGYLIGAAVVVPVLTYNFVKQDLAAREEYSGVGKKDRW
eukprot:PRCOL_00001134-RA